jgi:hypothetical protein
VNPSFSSKILYCILSLLLHVAQVLVTGLQQLQSLSSLTHLSFDAITRPPLPGKLLQLSLKMHKIPWLRCEHCQEHAVSAQSRLSSHHDIPSFPSTAKPTHPDDFPTPDYATQYPRGRLYAPFSLHLGSMPHLQSFRQAPSCAVSRSCRFACCCWSRTVQWRVCSSLGGTRQGSKLMTPAFGFQDMWVSRRFVADPCAVNFDTLPPGLTSLSALTSLHLNNCFAEAETHAFCGPPQLQHLALEAHTSTTML